MMQRAMLSEVEDFVAQRQIQDFARDIGVPSDQLCFWDSIAQQLHGSQRSKALKFNRLGLVQAMGDGEFQVKPIPGYNSTTYLIEYLDAGSWRCQCQHQNVNHTDCSHILAVLLYLQIHSKEVRINEIH